MSIAGFAALCDSRKPMREPSHKNPVPHNVLQEYLESLADTGLHPDRRLEKVLNSYAELQFRLHGGGHCAICHAAVRHVLHVRVEHQDGSVSDFQCLCARCLEAERVQSDRVTLTIGKAALVYTPNGKQRPTRHLSASRS